MALGQTELDKISVTEELQNLENTRNSAAPRALLQAVRTFLNKLTKFVAWDDSRSSVTASFLRMVRDDPKIKSYERYVDISSRARLLLTWSATKLTPQEAEQEGVTQLRNASLSEEDLVKDQRLLQSGGQIWETARNLPKPTAEELSKRGGQAKDIANRVQQQLQPGIDEGLKKLDDEGITNPFLLISSIALIVLMKNKLLAIVIILGLVYFFKQRQISEVQTQVGQIKKKIESAL